jgi:hypothetical protein
MEPIVESIIKNIISKVYGVYYKINSYTAMHENEPTLRALFTSRDMAQNYINFRIFCSMYFYLKDHPIYITLCQKHNQNHLLCESMDYIKTHISTQEINDIVANLPISATKRLWSITEIPVYSDLSAVMN